MEKVCPLYTMSSLVVYTIPLASVHWRSGEQVSITFAFDILHWEKACRPIDADTKSNTYVTFRTGTYNTSYSSEVLVRSRQPPTTPDSHTCDGHKYWSVIRVTFDGSYGIPSSLCVGRRRRRHRWVCGLEGEATPAGVGVGDGDGTDGCAGRRRRLHGQVRGPDAEARGTGGCWGRMRRRHQRVRRRHRRRRQLEAKAEEVGDWDPAYRRSVVTGSDRP
uniref:Uncharacterized protein n=1 Tax=Oryza sativa subsp. japonica TaxID=39947 RepID=Q6K3U9_ORYSJ|nr:hypothetical protein [Oryza sativa Japonica Group]